MNGFHILQRRSGEREVMFNFSSFVEGGVETPVRRVSENQLPKNSCDLTTVLQRVFNVGGRVGAWVGFVGLSVDWMIELLVCLLIGFGKDTKLKEFVNNPTKKGSNPTQPNPTTHTLSTSVRTATTTSRKMDWFPSASTSSKPASRGMSMMQDPNMMMMNDNGHASSSTTQAAASANDFYEHRFSPYDFAGGTVVAVAGKDYVVLAADTRLSSGYSILSRDSTKLHPLTPTCVFAGVGSKNDLDRLQSNMDIQVKVRQEREEKKEPKNTPLLFAITPYQSTHKTLQQVYKHNHRKTMSTKNVVQSLSTTMYARRFFPYYVFSVVVGLDEKDGSGMVYTYDATGLYERTPYGATGSGQLHVLPLLDNVIGHRNRLDPQNDLPAEEVVEIIKDAFLSAGERDIYTGDTVEIMIVTKEGIQKTSFQLKAD